MINDRRKILAPDEVSMENAILRIGISMAQDSGDFIGLFLAESQKRIEICCRLCIHCQDDARKKSIFSF